MAIPPKDRRRLDHWQDVWNGDFYLEYDPSNLSTGSTKEDKSEQEQQYPLEPSFELPDDRQMFTDHRLE